MSDSSDQPGHFPSSPTRGRLLEVAAYFARLGFTAFGGPAAHVAMMERDLVDRRKWLDRQHFLDLYAAVNFIPGPNSTELAIALGYLRAGWRGLVIAGFCFITPAVLIILPIGWLYVMYHQRPAVGGILRGISPAVVAIVAVAVIRFARTAIRDRFSIVVALLAAGADLLVHARQIPAGDIVIMALAAFAGAIRFGGLGKSGRVNSYFASPLLAAIGAAGAAMGQPLLMGALFLKIGLTLFGSGYLLLPYLQSSFVDQRHWLSQQQLLDAIAVGQITPGPLLTTATFVGFILGDRWYGNPWSAAGCAVLATACIFAPAFGLIAIVGPFLEKLRKSPQARGALNGMSAAVVALIAVACAELGWQAIISSPHHWISVSMLLISFGILMPTKINSIWVLAAAAVAGRLLLA